MKRIPTSVLIKSILLCAFLLAAGLVWREALLTGEFPGFAGTDSKGRVMPTMYHPVFEFLKLVAAFFVGLTVTVFHRLAGHAPSFSASMERAQVLLCVSGALMMIIIGDSLARAFGIAGAASIIRFRTPVDDPQDTIVLFLSLGLGMACGLGAFGIVGLGTAFICVVLLYLAGPPQPKVLNLTVTSSESEFPGERVQQVLAAQVVEFQTIQITPGPPSSVTYRVVVPPDAELEQISAGLQKNAGNAVQSVAWELPKKKKA